MTLSPQLDTLSVMPNLGSQEAASRRGLPFWRTAWPEIGPADSESLRRKKLAVRIGHLAMILLLFAAAGSTPLAAPGEYTWRIQAALAVGCVAYALWNIVGTTGIVTLVLWEHRESPVATLRRPKCGTTVFFMVQTALATTIYILADHGRIPNMIWLLLLPPVAYAVFILEWRGIAGISALMLGVQILNLQRWHGWGFALYGGLAFSFAILFTLVFSMLAVQSEKARSEVQRLAAELADANRRLREYAVQAEELAATRERNRIGREIHDSLGHFLTVANMQLEAARALAPTNPTEAREAAGKAQAFIQEGLQDIRRSVAALRSSPLDDKPLEQAIHELIGRPGAETEVTFAVRGTPRRLPPPCELSLYRAAQEGLTNARKHARAKHVRLTLEFKPGPSVVLAVQDDGIGAAREREPGGFGLRGLHERAQLLDGHLEIQTAPNAGFRLQFEVPA